MISNSSRFANHCYSANATYSGHQLSTHSMDIISWLQLIINIAGVVGNAMIIVIFSFCSVGGRLPTLLFRTQAVFDLLVNIQSMLYGINADLWNVDSELFNYLLCRLWHSQFVFWYCVQLSIGNLVLIGLERYLALSRPIFYRGIEPTKLASKGLTSIAGLQLILAAPTIIQVNIHDGCCASQLLSPRISCFLGVYAIVWFLAVYLLSLILLVIFYTKIIFALRQSALSVRHYTRPRAVVRFTRLAIMFTIVYLTCLSYDAFAYLFDRTGVLDHYKFSSIWQRMGVLSVSLNSFANPYIYYLFLLRDSVRKRSSQCRLLPISNGHTSNGMAVIKRSSMP